MTKVRTICWWGKYHKAFVALFAAVATLAIPTLIDASSSKQVAQLTPLVVARTGHVSTVLADGRVLITGGRDSAGNIVAVSEIFDPATETATASATLTTPRVDHTATRLADGRVLVAGGTGASGSLSSAEIFDPSNPAAGFRVLASNMSAARARHTATLLNSGKVLIAGGDAAGTAEIFDPTTESFSPTLWNLAVPRTGHTATLFSDDSVLLGGGNTDSMELFTPADQKFTLDSRQMSAVRTGHWALELSDTRLLFFEGDTGHTIDEFNPSTDTLTLKDTLDAPASSATLLANGKILVLGPAVAGLYDPSAVAPNPAFTAFDETSLPNSSMLLRTGETATELSRDKKVFVAGGVDAQKLFVVPALFNPAKIWTDKDDYLPDEPVLLYGSGWKANEDVYLYAVDSETEQWTYGSTAHADTNGAFAVEPYFIVQMRHLGTTFDVDAVGAQSKLQADVTFTDAAKPTSAISFPANNGSYNSTGWNAGASSKITGTASFASGSTGRIVQVSVKRSSTGKYWTSGSSFNNTAENFVNATLVGTSWSLNFPATNFPADDTYVVHSLATDSNGQESGAGGVATFKFDNAAPAAPSAPVLASGSNSGSNADQITNVNTPNFVGTAEANNTITIFDGATQIASGTTASNGNYNVGPSSVLSDGAHTITAKAADAAGNQSGLSGSTSITIDTVRPTVTIDQASGQSDPTTTSPINFTVVFSEPVIGFTAPGAHLSGTAGATTAVVTGSGPTYNVAVSGMTTSGTVIATIGQNVATDVAANGNAASTSTDNMVQFNNCTAPSITTNPTNQTVTYGAASVSFSAVASGNPTPTVQWQVSVNNGAFADIAGATNTTYTINNPTVAMSGNKYRAVFTNSCNSGTATTNAATLTVNKANATFNITGYTVTYDGHAHTATGTATGVNGEDLSNLLDLSGTTHTDVGTYNDTWTFAGNSNYNAKTDGAVTNKINSATATVQLSNLNRTYDGSAEAATATTTPSGLNVTIDYKDTNNNPVASPTNAGSYSVTATINDPNYTGSATGTLVIAKASSTTTVNVSNATYDGSPHGGTASVSGAGGLGQSLTVHYVGCNGTIYASSTAAPTHAGDYTASTSYPGDSNHESSQDSQDYTISKANATMVVTPYDVTYDGNAHTASVTSITGVNGETGATIGSVDVSHTTHTNAGTYSTDFWSFTGTGNYNNIAATTITDKIGKADATVKVTPYDVTYDGNAHTATVVSITGVNGETDAAVGTVDVSNTQHTNASTYSTDFWSFTGTTNYNDKAATTITDKIRKANASITVTPYDVTYDGTAHTADGTATGVKGESLSGLDLSHTTHTSAGTYGSDYWSFTDSTGNYNDVAATTITDKIKKANATVVVTHYDVTYDGHTHMAAVTSITGVNGENGATVGSVDVSNTEHTNAGTYSSDSWSFTGTANYNDIAATPITDKINKANATVVVTAYDVTYDGHTHTASVASITGMNGETGATVGSVEISNTTHTNAGTYSTDFWSFTGTANYNDIAATSITDKIAKADATVVVTPYDVTYNAQSHTATVASITGVNGETGATVGTVDVSHTIHTNAGTYSTDSWSFTGGLNYNDMPATTIIDKIAKVDAVVSVTGYTGTYDGSLHGASGTVAGVDAGSAALGSSLNLGDTFKNVPGGTAQWVFSGGTNYNDQSGEVGIVITKAHLTVTSDPKSKTYDGTAFTAFTVTLSGFVNGENSTFAAVTGTPGFTGTAVGAIDAGTYTITPTLGTLAAPNYDFTSFVHGSLTIGKAPLTITAENKTMQYSDPVAFTVVYAGFANGEGPSVLGGTLAFSPTAAVAQFYAPGPYTITPSGLTSGNYAITFKTGTLTVTAEDARATYTGALFASTSSATSSTATVTLSATIRDITAATGDPAYDAYPGDIRNAKVTFINRDTNTVIASNLPVGLVSVGDTKTGTTTYNWSANIGSADSVQYTIGIIVNGYYTDNISTEDAVVTVSKAIPGMITGGGYLVEQYSAGLVSGASGSKNNFGFNVKNASNGPKGNINAIVRNNGRTYQIKGNAMTSLATNLTITATHPYPTATFNGKASIQDITNPLQALSVDGNATLQVTMTDAGEPGSSDTIGITVWNKAGGLWFSSNWNGTKTIEQVLGGGNLQVR